MTDVTQPSILPPDVIFLIFERVPNLYTATSLRLSCRAYNDIYETYRKQLEQIQIDRIIRPFTSCYQFLTTLHVDADQLILPRRDWNITMPKVDFASAVARRMPIIRRRIKQKIFLTQHVETLDWIELWEQQRALQLDKTFEGLSWTSGLQQHCLAISGDGTLWLDTMHGRIYDSRHRLRGCSKLSEELSVANYWSTEQQNILNWRYLFPITPDRPVLRTDDAYPKTMTHSQLQEVISIYRMNGWPLTFDKAQAVVDLRAFWQANDI